MLKVAEYDSDEAIEIYREDGRDEGKAEERQRIFNELIACGISPEIAAKCTKISLA